MLFFCKKVFPAKDKATANHNFLMYQNNEGQLQCLCTFIFTFTQF